MAKIGGVETIIEKNRSQFLKDYGLGTVPHLFFCLTASKTVGKIT